MRFLSIMTDVETPPKQVRLTKAGLPDKRFNYTGERKARNMLEQKQGKIYKVVSPSTEACYIGSTNLKYLSMRFSRHRADAKTGAKRYKDLFDYNDARIELLEDYPCSSREALLFRERYWIENTPNVVNKQNPITTRREYMSKAREYQKRWYWENGGREIRKKEYDEKHGVNPNRKKSKVWDVKPLKSKTKDITTFCE